MAAKTAPPRLVNLMYMIGSVVIIALSIPLVLQKIGPNGFYGFRTAKTMSSPAFSKSASSAAVSLKPPA